jgi:hypothetical protein
MLKIAEVMIFVKHAQVAAIRVDRSKPNNTVGNLNPTIPLWAILPQYAELN